MLASYFNTKLIQTLFFYKIKVPPWKSNLFSLNKRMYIHPQRISQVDIKKLKADPIQTLLLIVFEELLTSPSSLASASADIINPSALMRVSLSTVDVGALETVGAGVVISDARTVGK